MVEWKNIEDICSNVFAGGTPSTKHEEYYDGNIPWIRSGEIDFNIIKSAERNITEAGYKNSSAKKIRKNSVVMAMTGATVAKTAVVEIETTANQSVCAMEINETIANYKYLFYCLANDYFKIKSSAQGALTSLNLAMIKQISIPIPSKSEQERIVSILDTFTSSISNLKEQIKERRKQYEYYRDQLLDLEGKDGVEMKTLGEVCDFSQGIQVPISEQFFENKEGYSRFLRIIDYTQGNEPPRYVTINDDRYKVLKDDIAIVRYGASAGYVCTGLIGVLANNLFKINITNGYLTPKYLLCVLKSKIFQSVIQQIVNVAAMPAISFTQIRVIQIPIPSKEEQSRIVSILDQFEASIANLEAQLKEREKQYEYYRNQLLTFE